MLSKYPHMNRMTFSHQALNILNERILDGQFPPGSRLVVDVLARQLGISCTPVCETLSKLVSMGLIVCDGKGNTTTTYTSKDVSELFAIGRALEVLAIPKATKNLATNDFARIRFLCERAARHNGEQGENCSNSLS